MPNRIIRDNILTSEAVAALDWAAEVFYRRLHSIVDDYGRHEAGHQLLRAKCYPLQTDQVRVADIARWMAACQKSGVILVYGVGGKQYLEVCKFGQPLRSASKCPPPPTADVACEQLQANDFNCEQARTNAELFVSVSECVSECEEAPAKRPPRAAAPDKPEHVDDQTWADWLALRKAKRAPVTATVLRASIAEAEKAGMTLEQFLRVWCRRGSQGLEADWLKPAERNGFQRPPETESPASRRRL